MARPNEVSSICPDSFPEDKNSSQQLLEICVPLPYIHFLNHFFTDHCARLSSNNVFSVIPITPFLAFLLFDIIHFPPYLHFTDHTLHNIGNGILGTLPPSMTLTLSIINFRSWLSSLGLFTRTSVSCPKNEFIRDSSSSHEDAAGFRTPD